MTLEEYETVKFRMVERQLERDQKLRQFSEQELAALYDSCAITIQRVIIFYVKACLPNIGW